MNDFDNQLLCLECQFNPVHSRGLCNTCYSRARRNGLLSDWPTQPFLDNPEDYARWLFEHYPELLDDIAIEYHKRVVVG
jgi:hypothetical protein